MADYPVRDGEGKVLVPMAAALDTKKPAFQFGAGTFPVRDGLGNVQVAKPEGAVTLAERYKRVVIVGASLEFAMYGYDLATPHADATNALNNGLPVYGACTSGETISQLIDNVQAAVAAYPAVGDTLFVIHPTGNNVTNSIEYASRSAAELNAIRADLNAFLDAFGAHLPHVMPVLSSFRTYVQRGYAQREIFNGQQKGSKPFNDNVFLPIYQARTRSIWRYADGTDPFCFYDYTRNNFLTIISDDGVHFATGQSVTVRNEEMRRLRLWLAGTPDIQITPAIVDPPQPVVVKQPSIVPASGAIGTLYTLTPAVFTGTPAPTITGTLTQNGVNVTGQIVNGQFTSTAEGPLVYTSTGQNAVGTASAEAKAVNLAVAPPVGVFVNFVSTQTARPGLNQIDGRPIANASGIGPFALIDVTGAASGISYSITRQGGGVFTSAGMNAATNEAAAPAWDGTSIYCLDVLDDVLYIPYGSGGAPGMIGVHTLSGLVPNASYNVHFVASRATTGTYTTRMSQGGVVVDIDPLANPPQADRTAVMVANASGVLEFTQTPLGTFSYLCGFSISRVP